MERYTETKERADELDGKIQCTDDLIEEIVYELYGLTDEEIEIVQDAVANTWSSPTSTVARLSGDEANGRLTAATGLYRYPVD